MKDKRILAALAAVLLIFFLMNRRRPNSPEVSSPQTAKTANGKPSPKAAANLAPLPKVNLPKTLAPGSVALAKAEDQIALQRSGYVIKRNGERLLELRLEARASCHSGDLDVIKAALGGRDSQMLVTIEPMSGFKRSAIAHPISYSALLKGTVLQFPIHADDPELYGLFICGDAHRQNKCQGKPAAKMSEPDPKLAKAGNDLIFYFQPLILEKNRFLVFEGSGRATASLDTYFKARGNGQSDAVAESRRLNEALESIPATSSARKDGNGNTLHLTLPFLEMHLCAKDRVRVQ